MLVGVTGFLNVTTCETKTDFLLIEVFRKLFNPQNYGRQGSILGGLSCSADSVIISIICKPRAYQSCVGVYLRHAPIWPCPSIDVAWQALICVGLHTHSYSIFIAFLLGGHLATEYMLLLLYLHSFLLVCLVNCRGKTWRKKELACQCSNNFLSCLHC